jgi:hypothetical protein
MESDVSISPLILSQKVNDCFWRAKGHSQIPMSRGLDIRGRLAVERRSRKAREVRVHLVKDE